MTALARFGNLFPQHQRPTLWRLSRFFSVSESVPVTNVPNPALYCSSGQDKPIEQIAKYYNQAKLWNYNVNYVKVGQGPHAVFCYPGILGEMNTQLTQVIQNFERHSDQYTFYAWDQPGFGKSKPPERVFTDNSFQEDVDMSFELMRNLGHDKYSLMGWSGGGAEALLFAIQHSELVNKLVVWGAFASVDKESADMFQWFRKIDNWGGKMQEVLIEEHGYDFFTNSWQTWMDIFIRIHTHYGDELCAKRLDRITCPTLILHGAKDKIVGLKHGKLLHENIKNSKLLIMEDGKHNIQIRYPDEFFKAVHDFLQEKIP